MNVFENIFNKNDTDTVQHINHNLSNNGVLKNNQDDEHAQTFNNRGARFNAGAKRCMHLRQALLANCNYSFSVDLTHDIIMDDFELKGAGKLSDITGLKPPCNYDMVIKNLFESLDIQIYQMCYFTNNGGRPSANTAMAGFRNISKANYEGVLCTDLLYAYKKGNRHIEFEFQNKMLKRYVKYLVFISNGDDKNIIADIFAYDVTANRLEEIKQHEDTLRANEYLHNQMRIIRSFSSIYFATWNVDLSKNIITPIAIPQWLDCVAGDTKGNAKKAFVYFINKFITQSPTSKEKMLEFLNLDAISYNMTGETLMTCEYLGDTFGYVSANLIKVAQNVYGECTQVIFALRNIDAQKQRELKADDTLKEAMKASEKANLAKSAFLSRMSHDIRTPMNAIIGMTQIAISHIDDKDRLKDCLDKITISSRHLLELINEVLDMSRIESGKVTLNETRFDLLHLIDDLLVILTPLAAEKHHTLKIDKSGIIHNIVVGDELRIQRVFVNIISNSVKYTHPGGLITVKITERVANTRGISYFETVFEDNGIGMSEDFVNKIFDPFSREVLSGTVHDSSDAKIEGTGLGMSIVKSIVNMMDGDIKVESKLGVGSKFFVTMYLKTPIVDNSKKENTRTDDTADTATTNLNTILKDEDYKGRHILLAEDNELNSEIACEILSMMDLKVDVASDGAEAVNKLEKTEPNYYSLCFMDVQMPVLNGYDATIKIRNNGREDLKTIPIIAMTANAFAEDIIAAKAAGMNDHISKPLDIEKLKKILRTYIK